MKSLFTVASVLVAACCVTSVVHGQGACCLFEGPCVDVADVGECNAMAGVFLEGALCADDACGLGACCDGDNCVGEIPAIPCITSGRTFAGAGTTCLEDPCGSGVGECCLGGGACADTSPGDCATMGGAWLGAGTACADGLCDLGACCLPGDCIEMLNLECDALGGVFTPDVTCGDDPCDNDAEDCRDDALYGQSRDMPLFASVYTSEASAGFTRWDRFTAVPGAIETLTFWGLDLVFVPPDFIECSETDPTFEITFHADAGGAPGPAVCSYTLTIPPIATGVDYFGLDLLRYQVTLPDPCTLVNGWISIVGLGDEDCWFLWLSAREGDGFSLCHGCIAEVEGDDLAFCLGGTAGGVFGACCDDTSGTCVENVQMSDCTGPDQRFAPNGMCDDLVPDCGVLEGACCFEIDATCTFALEEDCDTMGGLWLGAFTLCDQCPCSVPCPEGATLEGEPVCGDGYVDLFNGGCGPNEAYSPISAGETVCGTNGVFTGISGETVPDSDWYQYNVNSACELRFTVEAEFRPIVAILTAPCPGKIIAGTVVFECEAVTVAANVTEGTYWLVVQAASNTDSAACPAEYVATLEVILPCAGDTDGDGDVDVDDLNNVILDWGTDGSANGGDITGPVPGSPPDGIVNVNDLNAIIVGWGRCP